MHEEKSKAENHHVMSRGVRTGNVTRTLRRHVGGQSPSTKNTCTEKVTNTPHQGNRHKIQPEDQRDTGRRNPHGVWVTSQEQPGLRDHRRRAEQLSRWSHVAKKRNCNVLSIQNHHEWRSLQSYNTPDKTKGGWLLDWEQKYNSGDLKKSSSRQKNPIFSHIWVYPERKNTCRKIIPTQEAGNCRYIQK